MSCQHWGAHPTQNPGPPAPTRGPCFPSLLQPSLGTYLSSNSAQLQLCIPKGKVLTAHPLHPRCPLSPLGSKFNCSAPSQGTSSWLYLTVWGRQYIEMSYVTERRPKSPIICRLESFRELSLTTPSAEDCWLSPVSVSATFVSRWPASFLHL